MVRQNRISQGAAERTKPEIKRNVWGTSTVPIGLNGVNKTALPVVQRRNGSPKIRFSNFFSQDSLMNFLKRMVNRFQSSSSGYWRGKAPFTAIQARAVGYFGADCCRYPYPRVRRNARLRKKRPRHFHNRQ